MLKDFKLNKFDDIELTEFDIELDEFDIELKEINPVEPKEQCNKKTLCIDK